MSGLARIQRHPPGSLTRRCTRSTCSVGTGQHVFPLLSDLVLETDAGAVTDNPHRLDDLILTVLLPDAVGRHA